LSFQNRAFEANLGSGICRGNLRVKLGLALPDRLGGESVADDVAQIDVSDFFPSV
jgi:hypothetical protein